MTIRVGIYGATGYAGLELLRLLYGHPHVEITLLGSNSNAGMDLFDYYPHLRQLPGRSLPQTLSPIDTHQAARETDLIFTALPSGVSSKLIPELMEAGCRVIDLSGDLRIPSDLYRKWYGHEPVHETIYKQFTYGLSELFRAEIAEATHISNPGCYATAVELALAPLLRSGMIRSERLIVDAKSGVTGAGRNARVSNLFAEIQENFSTYKVGRHQHTPEIEYHLQRLASADQEVRLLFTPQLVPMNRGILCTIYADVHPDWKGKVSTETLLDSMRSFYRDAKFVRIRPQGEMPSTRQVWGTNFCDLGAHYEDRTERILLVSVIDNLVKGAAGQAVQNFNIMHGFPEETGLIQTPANP